MANNNAETGKKAPKLNFKFVPGAQNFSNMCVSATVLSCVGAVQYYEYIYMNPKHSLLIHKIANYINTKFEYVDPQLTTLHRSEYHSNLINASNLISTVATELNITHFNAAAIIVYCIPSIIYNNDDGSTLLQEQESMIACTATVLLFHLSFFHASKFIPIGIPDVLSEWIRDLPHQDGRCKLIEEAVGDTVAIDDIWFIVNHYYPSPNINANRDGFYQLIFNPGYEWTHTQIHSPTTTPKLTLKNNTRYIIQLNKRGHAIMLEMSVENDIVTIFSRDDVWSRYKVTGNISRVKSVENELYGLFKLNRLRSYQLELIFNDHPTYITGKNNDQQRIPLYYIYVVQTPIVHHSTEDRSDVKPDNTENSTASGDNHNNERNNGNNNINKRFNNNKTNQTKFDYSLQRLTRDELRSTNDDNRRANLVMKNIKKQQKKAAKTRYSKKNKQYKRPNTEYTEPLGVTTFLDSNGEGDITPGSYTDDIGEDGVNGDRLILGFDGDNDDNTSVNKPRLDGIYDIGDSSKESPCLDGVTFGYYGEYDDQLGDYNGNNDYFVELPEHPHEPKYSTMSDDITHPSTLSTHPTIVIPDTGPVPRHSDMFEEIFVGDKKKPKELNLPPGTQQQNQPASQQNVSTGGTIISSFKSIFSTITRFFSGENGNNENNNSSNSNNNNNNMSISHFTNTPQKQHIINKGSGTKRSLTPSLKYDFSTISPSQPKRQATKENSLLTSPAVFKIGDINTYNNNDDVNITFGNINTDQQLNKVNILNIENDNNTNINGQDTSITITTPFNKSNYIGPHGTQILSTSSSDVEHDPPSQTTKNKNNYNNKRKGNISSNLHPHNTQELGESELLDDDDDYTINTGVYTNTSGSLYNNSSVCNINDLLMQTYDDSYGIDSYGVDDSDGVSDPKPIALPIQQIQQVISQSNNNNMNNDDDDDQDNTTNILTHTNDTTIGRDNVGPPTADTNESSPVVIPVYIENLMDNSSNNNKPLFGPLPTLQLVSSGVNAIHSSSVVIKSLPSPGGPEFSGWLSRTAAIQLEIAFASAYAPYLISYDDQNDPFICDYNEFNTWLNKKDTLPISVENGERKTTIKSLFFKFILKTYNLQLEKSGIVSPQHVLKSRTVWDYWDTRAKQGFPVDYARLGKPVQYQHEQYNNLITTAYNDILERFRAVPTGLHIYKWIETKATRDGFKCPTRRLILERINAISTRTSIKNLFLQSYWERADLAPLRLKMLRFLKFFINNGYLILAFDESWVYHGLKETLYVIRLNNQSAPALAEKISSFNEAKMKAYRLALVGVITNSVEFCPDLMSFLCSNTHIGSAEQIKRDRSSIDVLETAKCDLKSLDIPQEPTITSPAQSDVALSTNKKIFTKTNFVKMLLQFHKSINLYMHVPVVELDTKYADVLTYTNYLTPSPQRAATTTSDFLPIRIKKSTTTSKTTKKTKSGASTTKAKNNIAKDNSKHGVDSDDDNLLNLDDDDDDDDVIDDGFDPNNILLNPSLAAPGKLQQSTTNQLLIWAAQCGIKCSNRVKKTRLIELISARLDQDDSEFEYDDDDHSDNYDSDDDDNDDDDSDDNDDDECDNNDNNQKQKQKEGLQQHNKEQEGQKDQQQEQHDPPRRNFVDLTITGDGEFSTINIKEKFLPVYYLTCLPYLVGPQNTELYYETQRLQDLIAYEVQLKCYNALQYVLLQFGFSIQYDNNNDIIIKKPLQNKTTYDSHLVPIEFTYTNHQDNELYMINNNNNNNNKGNKKKKLIGTKVAVQEEVLILSSFNHYIVDNTDTFETTIIMSIIYAVQASTLGTKNKKQIAKRFLSLLYDDNQDQDDTIIIFTEQLFKICSENNIKLNIYSINLVNRASVSNKCNDFIETQNTLNIDLLQVHGYVYHLGRDTIGETTQAYTFRVTIQQWVNKLCISCGLKNDVANTFKNNVERIVSISDFFHENCHGKSINNISPFPTFTGTLQTYDYPKLTPQQIETFEQVSLLNPLLTPSTTGIPMTRHSASLDYHSQMTSDMFIAYTDIWLGKLYRKLWCLIANNNDGQNNEQIPALLYKIVYLVDRASYHLYRRDNPQLYVFNDTRKNNDVDNNIINNGNNYMEFWDYTAPLWVRGTGNDSHINGHSRSLVIADYKKWILKNHQHFNNNVCDALLIANDQEHKRLCQTAQNAFDKACDKSPSRQNHHQNILNTTINNNNNKITKRKQIITTYYKTNKDLLFTEELLSKVKLQKHELVALHDYICQSKQYKPKIELFELINARKQKFIIDLDLPFECHVLLNPPKHCQGNPIEMVWAFIKNYKDILEGMDKTCLHAISKHQEYATKHETLDALWRKVLHWFEDRVKDDIQASRTSQHDFDLQVTIDEINGYSFLDKIEVP